MQQDPRRYRWLSTALFPFLNGAKWKHVTLGELLLGKVKALAQSHQIYDSRNELPRSENRLIDTVLFIPTSRLLFGSLPHLSEIDAALSQLAIFDSYDSHGTSLLLLGWPVEKR